MPRLSILLLTASLFCFAGAADAQIVPMGDLHCNDATGQPAPPYEVGVPVEVSGIVTAGTGVFASYTSVHVQDDTGAIMLYRNDAPETFEEGDSITAGGTMAFYRGMTEIALETWTIHDTDRPLPEPLVMTCYEVAHQFGGDNCEPEESMFIRINQVTYSGSWGTGTLTLTDASGSCNMYIDADTGVQNMPPPDGEFDVIGILRQYDTSSPYVGGHQILPREPSDIIQAGPGIIEGPLETDIMPDQVTITWTTLIPATSRVDYGYTDSYELGYVEDMTLVTEHAVTLTGLEAARIHMYKVTTGTGRTETVVSGLRFCSGSRSSGDIEVYFNKLADTSLALGEEANDLTNLLGVLVPLIDNAESSIDIALYSFNLSTPADALINAHNRGVEIRFVTEGRTTLQDEVLRLIAAGIPVITDEYGSNNGDGLMHHKFWVFDHRLDTDPDNDYVLTGSWNITSQGTNTDAQNILVVQDESVAEIYTAEMNEMWGSETITPNPTISHIGDRKLDDTPKHLVIGGLPAVVYFGPSDDTMPKIVQRINETTKSVHFGILSFTRYDLANAMKNKFYSVPDYAVRGVFDSAESGNTYSMYHEMIGGGDYPWDPPADVWLDTESGSLHHKYMIFDVNDNGGSPAVLTGSSNWSNSAQYSNDENLIIIEDFRLANLYYQDFGRRYHVAGGSADLSVDVPETELAATARVNAFPNPALPEITIRLAPAHAGPVQISLHDVSGRSLHERHLEATGAETITLDWSFNDYPAGIYFLKVVGAGINEQRRVTLLR